MSEIKQLTDESTMPFGMHVGAKMKDVPAAYLLHLWDKPGGLHIPIQSGRAGMEVRDYVVRNFRALETECPDLIIEHRPEDPR